MKRGKGDKESAQINTVPGQAGACGDTGRDRVVWGEHLIRLVEHVRVSPPESM